MTEAETIHAEQLAELKQEHFATCMERLQAEGNLKALRDRQKTLEQSIAQLMAEGPEYRPLFDKPGDPNGWRMLPLAALELPSKVAKVLTGLGYKTVGALSVAMDEDQWEAKMPKIGNVGADVIADAFCEFWRKHPEYAEPAAE